MPEHYSKSTNRNEADARGGRVFDCAWQHRNNLLNVLLEATARFGAATVPHERKRERKAVKQALDAFNQADLALFGVVGAEDSLMTGRFLQDQLRKKGRAGSRWSTERRAGFDQALHMFEDWVRDLVERAKVVAEIPRVVGRPMTVGERAAIAQAEKERLLAENKEASQPDDGQRR